MSWTAFTQALSRRGATFESIREASDRAAVIAACGFTDPVDVAVLETRWVDLAEVDAGALPAHPSPDGMSPQHQLSELSQLPRDHPHAEEWHTVASLVADVHAAFCGVGGDVFEVSQRGTRAAPTCKRALRQIVDQSTAARCATSYTLLRQATEVLAHSDDDARVALGEAVEEELELYVGAVDAAAAAVLARTVDHMRPPPQPGALLECFDAAPFGGIADDLAALLRLVEDVAALPSAEGLERLFDAARTCADEDALSSRLFVAAVQPLLTSIQRWVEGGILDDGASAWFVIRLKRRGETAELQVPGTQFAVDPARVPRFLSTASRATLFAGAYAALRHASENSAAPAVTGSAASAHRSADALALELLQNPSCVAKMAAVKCRAASVAMLHTILPAVREGRDALALVAGLTGDFWAEVFEACVTSARDAPNAGATTHMTPTRRRAALRHLAAARNLRASDLIGAFEKALAWRRPPSASGGARNGPADLVFRLVPTAREGSPADREAAFDAWHATRCRLAAPPPLPEQLVHSVSEDAEVLLIRRLEAVHGLVGSLRVSVSTSDRMALLIGFESQLLLGECLTAVFQAQWAAHAVACASRIAYAEQRQWATDFQYLANQRRCLFHAARIANSLVSFSALQVSELHSAMAGIIDGAMPAQSDPAAVPSCTIATTSSLGTVSVEDAVQAIRDATSAAAEGLALDVRESQRRSLLGFIGGPLVATCGELAARSMCVEMRLGTFAVAEIDAAIEEEGPARHDYCARIFSTQERYGLLWWMRVFEEDLLLPPDAASRDANARYSAAKVDSLGAHLAWGHGSVDGESV